MAAHRRRKSGVRWPGWRRGLLYPLFVVGLTLFSHRAGATDGYQLDQDPPVLILALGLITILSSRRRTCDQHTACVSGTRHDQRS